MQSVQSLTRPPSRPAVHVARGPLTAIANVGVAVRRLRHDVRRSQAHQRPRALGAEAEDQRKTPPLSKYAWWVAIALASTSFFTAFVKYVMPPDLHMAFVTLFYAAYGQEQLHVLAAHPISENIHRTGGILYMMLGLFQLNTGFREKHRQAHRVLGRVFMALTVAMSASGAYMALTYAYTSTAATASVPASILMVACGLKSLLCIRASPPDVQGHREWATRCFAVALGPGMFRLMMPTLIFLTPFSCRELWTPTLWASWLVTLPLAEWAIRRQRTAAAAEEFS